MVLRALPETKVTQGLSLTRIAGTFLAERAIRRLEACATEQPGWLCYAATPSAQHFQECAGILGRCAFGVIIEVNLHIAVFF